jgi:hypothetical protein
MRSLDPPGLDAAGLYDSVSNRRAVVTKVLLRAVRPSVLAAYDDYENNQRDVTGLPPLPAPESTQRALRGNYDRLLQTHADVRDELLSKPRWGNCPSCGDRQATTLDHYLPRSGYPEFALFPLNLVPCCRDCNTTKLDATRSNGDAVYLHLYLDVLDENEQFLFASLDVVAGLPVITYEVRPPSSMSTRLAGRVCTHFAALDLAKYFARRALEEAGARAQVVDAQLAAHVPEATIRDGLREEAGYAARQYGMNHWKHAALEALADSQPFCTGALAGWMNA